MIKKQTKSTATRKKTSKNLPNATPIPPQKEMFFELEGKTYIVEKENGKIVNKTELDGKLVLECVLRCLKNGLNSLEEGK